MIEAWKASVGVAALVGGASTAVSLVASPGRFSTASLITVIILSLAACLIHRHLFTRATGLGRLFSIADQFPFGVVVYDADLSIRFANRYARKIYGRPLPEIVGLRDSDLLTQEAVALLSGELQNAIADGQVRSAETHLETGGRRQMFLMTFAAVENGDSNEREIISIWFETSKVDELSERLSRLNRTLSTHIAANRALIACDSEKELRQRFCESLCQEGGYELVWIGKREPDGGIRPVAAAGCDLADLEQLQIRWTGADETSLPVARALLENKPFHHTHHAADDPRVSAIAEHRGLKSCAGLPIRINGQPDYSLCVCSQREEAFDAEEMKLLTQLAHDAGFATESVRNREYLNESRESLAEAQSIARLGTWHYQLSPGTFRWSTETYRIHGWPQDSPLKLASLESLVHPDDRTRAVSAVNRLLREAKPVDIEYRLLLANEEIRHLRVCGKALTNEDNKVVALTGTVLNVTEHKARDAKDRAFEQMLVGFLENLPAVVTLKNEQLEHVYGNTAALEFFHVESSQFVGTTDTAFLSRDTADLLHAVERSVLNTRQPVLTPEIPVVKQGERRTLRGLCFPVLLPGGQILVGMYATDITELQTATAKTGLLESALEAAANGVVITDTGGVIKWVNTAFSRITGYSAEEAIGQTPRILKSGRYDKEFYEALWATLQRGEVWNGEIENRKKDGTLYHEQMTITPVRDAAGKTVHYIAIKSDITKQKEMEDKLLRSQRMESIGLLAGGVAHDLNNILSPILMGTELLRTNELPEKDRDELLDSIAQNCERGAGIIRQVLTFARGVDGERVIVQLRHQVKEIVKMAKETFPKDIQISMDVSNAFWTVIGDATQLHQILLNFSVNARDAMPQGGKLEFIGENVELAEGHSFQGVELGPGRYARLTVRDSGTGMPAEVLDRIFEPFFTTKAQGKGTGLGLPTVLGIVKSHGGLAEFQTAPGKGTSAIIWLPAADSQDEGKKKVQSTPPMGHNETILLVDDEDQVLSVTAMLLERANYQVITAEDGASAVAQYATHMEKIALIITDIMMPVMDGVALAHALRRINPGAKIIGSSGFSGDGGSGDRVEELKRASVKTLLQKPYSSRQLLETVAEELKNQAADQA